MTVSSTTNKAQFSGSGTTGPFPFSFKTFAEGDLAVIKTSSAGVDATLTLATNYTVSLNADQNNDPGGDVTLVSALAVGETLTILRTVDATQETDIANGGGFYPEVIENSLDRLTMLCQQNAEVISRAVVVGVSALSVTPEELLDAINAAQVATAADVATANASVIAANDSAVAAAASAVDAAASVALVPSTTASQAEMEAGTEVGVRLVSPLLVAQAIAAQNVSNRLFLASKLGAL
jgi:hypothetical protein